MARENLWSEAEVTSLIAIWDEEEIHCQLDGTKRNITVYKKIVEKLQENGGFECTAIQCREKYRN